MVGKLPKVDRHLEEGTHLEEGMLLGEDRLPLEGSRRWDLEGNLQRWGPYQVEGTTAAAVGVEEAGTSFVAASS